jgi:hypothetical protein
MSAGEFLSAKYQSQYLATNSPIHPIKVQPETLSATINSVPNAQPTVALNNPISAKVSGSKRTIGLTPRKVTLEFTGEEAPDGYETGGQTTIPCLTPTFYAACLLRGATGTYLGTAVKVVSTSPEYVK